LKRKAGRKVVDGAHRLRVAAWNADGTINLN
jgi:hypothetical protein